MDKVYALPAASAGPFASAGVLTAKLPHQAELQPTGMQTAREEPSAEVRLALGNLVRLGLVVRPSTYGAGDAFWLVYRCSFGQEFMRACT